MRWAFWRRERDDADRSLQAGRSGAGDEDDPAAQLRARARRRLIGAAALLIAAVIVVPMLLDPGPRPVQDTVRITVASESAPAAPRAPLPARDEQLAAGAQPEAASPAPPPTTSTPVASERPPSATQAPTAPAPSTKPAPARPAEAPHGAVGQAERFALQVAALASAPAANELVARLKKAGFPAYTESIATAEGTRHRVRVGPFGSREEAQRMTERMRSVGYTAALVGA